MFSLLYVIWYTITPLWRHCKVFIASYFIDGEEYTFLLCNIHWRYFISQFGMKSGTLCDTGFMSGDFVIWRSKNHIYIYECHNMLFDLLWRLHFFLGRLTHCGLVTPFGYRYLGHIGLGDGLLPDDTKPFPEPLLTCQQRCCVEFTWGQFHRKCSEYLSLITLRNQWVNNTLAIFPYDRLVTVCHTLCDT